VYVYVCFFVFIVCHFYHHVCVLSHWSLNWLHCELLPVCVCVFFICMCVCVWSRVYRVPFLSSCVGDVVFVIGTGFIMGCFLCTCVCVYVYVYVYVCFFVFIVCNFYHHVCVESDFIMGVCVLECVCVRVSCVCSCFVCHFHHLVCVISHLSLELTSLWVASCFGRFYTLQHIATNCN